MGAWGHHFDENDSALDWISEFEDAPSWSHVQNALQTILEADNVYDLDTDETSAALVAGEIVAAALGRANERLQPNIQQWVAANTLNIESLQNDAARAAALIKSDSELRELWDDSEDAAEWVATVDGLISRLT
jgi:Domain of unknown function (DUF4259)